MPQKKLLLILPRAERGYSGHVRSGRAGFVRLSLPTLAGITPPHWQVRIHDARQQPVDFDEPTDLVGITGFTNEMPFAYATADAFRSRGVPVVLGGVHVTALPDEALRHADAIVVGEAEDVWPELLADAEKGQLRRRYAAEAYYDMQGHCDPRLDLLDRDRFTTFNVIQATRGCPFDCDYCAVTGVFGRKFRRRPVEEVVEGIRRFVGRRFFFVDDNICGHPQYARELFRALIPLKKKWGGQTSITFARDPELLELYAAAGGEYAFIGLETVSAESLASINKGWGKAEEYGEAIRTIHRAGIDVCGSFIFGLDSDDAGVFQRTLDFVNAHKLSAAYFHILTPFPGTRMFDRMKADGRIIDDDWAKYNCCEVVIEPQQMTAQELQQGFYWAHQQLYNWPSILRRSLRSPRHIVRRLAANISFRNKTRLMPAVPRDWRPKSLAEAAVVPAGRVATP